MDGRASARNAALNRVQTGEPRALKNVKVTSNRPHRFCIAPMMDWTDRHCRFLHRLLTRRALIYTEMITTGAVLCGDRARHEPARH